MPAPPDGRRREARPVLEALLGIPFTDGNTVDVLRNGDETFPALLDAISRATRTIDMLWFVWGQGTVERQFADALAGRARDGVRVRVLLDAYGSQTRDPAHITLLRDAGCQVLVYRPVPSWRPSVWNLRSHRRVLVCDETVAFTGGTGIADSWAGGGDRPGDWRDTAFRVRGPAVAGIRSGFVLPWMQARTSAGQEPAVVQDEDEFPPLPAEGRTAVQALRPSSGPGWNDAALAVAALLHLARHRIRVTTPYVRLPWWLSDVLVATARRGVEVQLLVSGPHVERPAVHLQGEREYQALLDAGVQIWRFQPTLLHAKVITVDGEIAMVGTANLDIRSLALNEQQCLLLQDEAVVGVLDQHFESDLASSAQVDAQQWRSRPLSHRALESAANVVGRPLRGWGAISLSGRWPRNR